MIDDTFATRDLVADVNHAAVYRVVTISNRTVRVLIGDHRRLVEECSDSWPMVRSSYETTTSWGNEVVRRLRAEQRRLPLSTVVAGVERSVRHAGAAIDPLSTIGVIPGNHDRTSWVDLHNAAWPLVADWLRTGQARALERLDWARSACRYAGGLDEVWTLANDGRVELVVVGESLAMAARLDDRHGLQRADHEREARGVVDDLVDDILEAVLRHGGNAVIVGDAQLQDHQRIAATLRY